MDDQETVTVQRPIVSILSDLRTHAATHSDFEKHWKDKGVDFTEESLDRKARALPQKRTGLRGLLKPSPSFEQKRWAVVCAWADTAGVRTWVKVPKRR